MASSLSPGLPLHHSRMSRISWRRSCLFFPQHSAFLISQNSNPASDFRTSIVSYAGKSRSGSRRRGQGPSVGRPRRNSTGKKKPSEPYTRHPDDYYKFGPYGPYSHKAPVIGTMKPWTRFSDDHVFMWSTISDLNQSELVEIQNACISYDNIVGTFDERVGLQFFYVFVRLPFRYCNQAMWKEWTLVSEITVESGEALEKFSLTSKLSFEIKNRITKHTGWIRPDLVFVKKPSYQIRFEPQLDFIGELRKMLLETAGEAHENDSYYGKFCRILGLQVDASHEVITSTYEKSPEETQLACLEHLFTLHPVKLMYYVPYPHLKVWTKEPGSVETKDDTSSLAEDGRNPGEQEKREINQNLEEDISRSMELNQDESSLYYESSDADDETGNDEWENHGDDVTESDEQNDEGWGDDDFQKGGDIVEGDIMDLDNVTEGEDDNVYTTLKPSPFLKAAARPYTYVNFIREMVMLRSMMLERKKSGDWR